MLQGFSEIKEWVLKLSLLSFIITLRLMNTGLVLLARDRDSGGFRAPLK